jgi:hypothetical protein
MRSSPSSSSSWLSRNQADPPSLDTHQLSLSPSFASPRSASKTPTFKNPTFKGFQSVFQRKPPRSPSAVSLHSSDSFDIHNHHPYAAMPPPPPLAASHDTLDDEQECPVCLEPLSFSFRLPGEKPHVVPECGHSLHEVSTQIARISHSVISPSCRPVSLPFMVLCLPNRSLLSPASPTWASAVSAAVP